NSAYQEQLVRRFIRKLALLIAVKQTLTFVTVWCFVWGIIALVVRAATGVPRKPLLWGAVGIGVAGLFAAIVSRKQLPSRNAVRALLDNQNDCGGLLMAGTDVDVGSWRIPELTLPRLRWRKARALGFLIASISFVAVSMLTPLRFVTMNAARPMDVSNEA